MANRFDYRGGEHEAWLDRVVEPILEPDLPIVDAHHHLWIRNDVPYLLREFAADLQQRPPDRRNRVRRMPFDVSN